MSELFEQTQEKAPTPTGIDIVPETEKVLNEALQSVYSFWPAANTSVMKAEAALSMFPDKITDDETDEKLMKTLIRVKETYEKVNTQRMSITKPINELLSALIVPEKRISIDAKETGSAYNIGKAKRNVYANKKFQKAEQERLDAIRTQKVTEEKLRIKSEIEKNVLLATGKAVRALEQSVNEFLKDISLENFDEKQKRFAVELKLKADLYAGWFDVPFNRDLISMADYKAIVDEISQTLTYEKVNADYLKDAQPIFDKKRDSLPDVKARLIELDELSKSNKAAADAQRQLDEEQKERERIAAEEEFAKSQAEKSQAIELSQAEGRLTAHFNAAVQMQSVTTQSNVRETRTAIITAPDEDTVAVLSEVIFSCFTHPKFKGIIETEKDGTPKYEMLSDGITKRPVYTKWVETLLSFYADNCNATVKGIAIVKGVSTIQKKAVKKDNSENPL